MPAVELACSPTNPSLLNECFSDRFLVARADIPAETVLFTVPRDAIISVATSDLAGKLPDLFNESDEVSPETEQQEEDVDEALDSWGKLILVMIYEYLQGDQSRWKPYFDVLPESFDTPMFWSDEELRELQASNLLSKIGKDDAERMFLLKILPIVEKHDHIFYPSRQARLEREGALRLCHRMGSTIMAYAFDLENEEDSDDDGEDGWVEDTEGRTMLGMVPMADTLNADAEFNVSGFDSVRWSSMGRLTGYRLMSTTAKTA
jgi:N-lysine methyltransferase SETD6